MNSIYGHMEMYVIGIVMNRKHILVIFHAYSFHGMKTRSKSLLISWKFVRWPTQNHMVNRIFYSSILSGNCSHLSCSCFKAQTVMLTGNA
ncbi:hypothetical protein PsgB076_27600 [Pseudomonas savastanoi pv. glycinea str. B076]|nr:hypothetical protein PsgB076_27600 [Pseudomonas savastanoi pv. glycinea str. B076]